MEVILELPVGLRLKKMIEYVRSFEHLVDAVTIPDAPLGRPVISPILVASKLIGASNIEPIPHIRVSDYNKISLKEIVMGLKEIGIRRTVFLKGDIIENIASCFPSAEEALKSVLEASKEHYNSIIEIGALLSTRRPLTDIRARISTPFSFFYVLRSQENISKLSQIAQIASKQGKRIYAYIVVASRKDYQALSGMLGSQPVLELEHLDSFIIASQSYVNGFVVSSPLSKQTMIKALSLLRKII